MTPAVARTRRRAGAFLVALALVAVALTAASPEAAAQSTNFCSRTAEVVTRIRSALSLPTWECWGNLSTITGNLILRNLTSLQSGDLDGMSGVTTLFLSNSSGLTSLPASPFDEMTSLTSLLLSGTGLTSLPTGMFDNQDGLTRITLPSLFTLDVKAEQHQGLVRARIDEAAPLAVSVTWTASDGGSGTATIAAGERTSAVFGTASSQDVTVTLSNPTFTGVSESTSDTSGSFANFQLGVASGGGASATIPALPTVTLAVSSSSIAESGGVTTVTAALSGTSGQAVTVTVGATAVAGTGAVAGDFMLSTAKTLTIAAGATTSTGTVTVTAVDNTVSATGKQVTVSGTATGGNGVANPSSVTVTITDDDAPSLSISSPSVAEGDSGSATLRFVVTLSVASTQQVTVGYDLDATDGGTATAGTDYTALTAGTLTFAAGTTSQNIDVAVTGDTQDEENETIRVTLSSPSNATGTPTGVGTITDDDDPPSLSISAPSVTEGNSGSATLRFVVTLGAVSGREATVGYGLDATDGGTATAGTDYTTLTAGTLTFAAGTTSRNIDVAVTGDRVDEKNETVRVTLNSPSNATGTPTGVGTITDDDTAGVTFSPTTLTVTEGDATTKSFTMVLHTQPEETVYFSLYPDAGVVLRDTQNNADVVFPAGFIGNFTTADWNTAQTVHVRGAEDNDAQDDEIPIKYALARYHSTVDVVDGPTTRQTAVTVTVEDDDGGLDVGTVSGNTTEAGGTATFTVALLSAPNVAVTVAVASRDQSEGTALPESLTFSGTSWNTAQTVTVTGQDDAIDDENVQYKVRLTPATTDTVYRNVGAEDVTLTNEDNDDPPSLSISSPSVTEGNSGTVTLRFAVTLSAVSGREVTVGYGLDATDGGTASAGTDYTTLTAGTLTFAAGTTSGNIDVAVTGDTQDEPDETVRVTLSSPSNATGTPTGVGTITDDDAAPTVTLAVTPATLAENGGRGTVTATLSHASSAATTVTVTAGAGLYTLGTDATITIAAGNTANAGDTAEIVAVDNSRDEVDRAGTVTATAANAQGIGSVTGAALTLTDDDAAPSLSISSPSVGEGNSGTVTLRFVVTLSAASGREVTVGYGLDTTDGGTAAAGTDYTTLTAGTLTFTAGTTSRNIDVAVTGDTRDEADETVRVTLNSPSNATGTPTGVGTITDDDAAPSLSISSPSVGEGNSGSVTLRFVVTLSAASGREVTVGYGLDATDGGTASAGTDYTTLTAGTLTFAAGTTSRNIDVAVTGDTRDEADETIRVTLNSPSNATGTPTGVGTITDDDGEPTLSISSPSVTEGNSGTVTLRFVVTLSAVSGREVTVGYGLDATDGGTASAGTDYTTLTAGTLTFAAGTTSGNIDVAVTGDTQDEPDETVRVTLSSPSNATGTPTGVGTITDDDAAPTVTLAVTPATLAENGGRGTVTATLSHASSAATTVTVTAGAGLYTVGTDATITIAAGTTANAGDTAEIVAVDNSRDEVDRAGTVTATAANAQGIGSVTGAALTLTDDDAAPSLSISSPSVGEGNSGTVTLRFVVTLSAASGREVTVGYGLDTTDGGTASAGTDYTTLTAGTLTFAAGTTSGNIDVAVTGDTRDEADETVRVTLNSPSNATGTPTGVGTITDDDGEPTLSISSPSVTEGNSGTVTLRFVVTLSAVSGREVTVGYGLDATDGGTASAGTDYTTLTAGTLTFAAGTTSGNIDVAVTGDTQDEPDETVRVTLSSPSNATGTPTGVGTITDDDAAPTVTLAVTPATLAENGGRGTVTATLSHASSAATTVTVTAGAGLYTVGTDATITIAAGTTANAGDTAEIVAVDNSRDEVDRAGTVTATAANAQGIGSVTGAALTLTDDDAAPSLSISSPSVGEGNSGSVTLRFVVTLNAASGREVTVGYGLDTTDGGTASAGTDYTTLTAGTLTFAAGTTSGNIDVAVTGDTRDEADETIRVTLNSPSNATGTPTGVGTITDDDGEPTLSISSPSVTEGNSGSVTLRFVVTLSAVSGREVTVGYGLDATDGGTASAGTDYTTLTAGTLTFAAGTTSGNIDVAVTGDTQDEPDETVRVTLSSPSNATGTPTGVGTITDDDAAPTVTLAVTPATLAENGGRGTVTATLSHASSAATTVTVTAGAGLYTVGTDATITIAAGTTANAGDTAEIVAVDNSRDEVDRAGTVTATAANAQGIGSVTGAALTLTDDDAAPSLSISSPSVGEGNSGTVTLRFVVTLSAASGREVTVGYGLDTTDGGTAAAGTDYTTLTAGTLTFTAGTTSRNIDVAVTGDTRDEADETVRVTLNSPSNATGTPTGVGTITDDDGEPTLSISSPSVTEGNSGTVTLRFVVTLSAVSGREVTVGYGLDATDGGTASAGTDYTTLTAGTLTFAAGTTSGNIDVAVTGDTQDEPDETVRVTLSSPSNATGTPTGVGTITDDDAAPTVTLAVTPATLAENGGRGTVTATLSHASSAATTVTVTAGAGLYTVGTDATITIAAGTTANAGDTAEIVAVDNSRDEVDRAGTVTATAANAQGIGSVTGAALTLTDDDAAPSLSISSPSVGEGNSGTVTLRFVVTLSAASGREVTVGYGLDTTDGGTASAGTDYTTLTAGTLTFAAGTTSRNIDVAVTGDTRDEADETVRVTLSSPSNATGTPTGVGTITDDDGEPTLSISSPSVTEGNSGSVTLRFVVTLSAVSGREVTVGYGLDATDGGTASAGTDYTALTAGTLTFAAGTTSGNIDVAVTGDTQDEPDETVRVTLSSPSNATGTPTGVGTITDDDAAPTVTLAVTPATLAENGGRGTVTATLSHASSAATTVTVTAGAGLYTLGTDATITIAAGSTANAGDTAEIVAVDNSRDEVDRAGTVTATAANAQGIGSVTGAAVTLTDDDAAPSLSISSPSVGEGNSGSVTLRFVVTLNAASGREVTVGYGLDTTDGGTASAGTDYTTLTAGTLTFTAGTTSQNIDVAVTGDTRDEADETIRVTLNSPSNATGTPTGVGTITDDDDPPSLSINSPSVGEGNSGSVTLRFVVTLSAASGREVTVGYGLDGTDGGTAAAGTDYTALTAGTLTFAAGTTTRNIDVAVTGDTQDEPDETVRVTLNSPSNATGTPTGVGTITDDDDPPSLSISSPSVGEGNSGSVTLRFVVTLSAVSGREVTVGYGLDTTDGGTASAGTDYTTLTAGTLTFTAGTTTRNIDVAVTGDTRDEPDETVRVTLNSPSNATGTPTGIGTITDDDAEPSLSISSPSVTEGNSGSVTLRFVVTLSAASGREVTVGYGLDTTDGGTANAGTDYTTLTAGTLTFAAGTTSQNIDVAVTGDTQDEPDETVRVTLNSPSNATGTPTGVGTITDDDDPPSLSINSPSVTEGNSGSVTLRFVVTLSAASGREVTVGYGLDATDGGTASAGTDYTAVTPGTLTFTAGTTSGNIDVAVTGDARDEPDETVRVTLSSPSNATGTPTGVGTIRDDDDRGLALSLPSVAVNEDATAPYTVALATQPTGDVAVRIRGAHADVALQAAGQATSVETLWLSFTPADWDTAQTVTVHALADADTDNEAAALEHTATGGDYGTVTATLPVAVTDTTSAASPAPGTDVQAAFAAAALPDQTYKERQQVRVQLPAATTGNPPLTYTLTPALPPGLRYDAATRRIGGAATAPAIGTYTHTVTDADGDDATQTVRIEIVANPQPTFATPAPSYTRGESYMLPAPSVADGGRLVFALTPALPAGLRYTPPVPSGGPGTYTYADGGTITGVPDGGLPTNQYTLTVTDPDGDMATVAFRLAQPAAPPPPPPADRQPTFGTAAVDPQQYRQGETITPLVLPAATGGDTPLSYALTPALPAGLTYTAPADARTGGMLSGTPTALQDETTYTLTATDADGDTATLPFPLTVEADLTPSFGDATVAARGYPVGMAIAPLVLPAGTGGNAPLSYALTPTLPPGLTYIAPADPTVSGGTLAGTPTEVRAAATYTLTATDTDGDTATLTFPLTITATGRLVPGEGTTAYPIGGQQLTITRHPDTPAVEIDLPTTLARDVTVTLSPPAADVPLARGQFGFGTGAAARAVVDISVVPVPAGGVSFCLPVPAALRTEASGRAVVLLHYDGRQWAPVAGAEEDAAAGQVCATGVTTFSPFAVGYANAVPNFADAPDAPQRYEYDLDMAIAPVVLPAATGGDAPLSYTLTPPDALPAGLTYTAPVGTTTAGRIAGTPTTPHPATTYTLTATDRDGDRATLTFIIAVERAQVTVADARGQEGGTVVFPVTLSRPLTRPLTLTWTANTPGSATPGEDYEAEAAGRLTLAAGVNAGTLTVRTLDDRRVEPPETFTVTVTLPAGVFAEMAAATAVGTIEDDDTEQARRRSLGMVLAGVGRTLATDAVDVIGDRFVPQPTTMQATVGGQEVSLRREGDTARWRHAAGVAYGVARALGVEVGSPVEGGDGQFGQVRGAAWSALTRHMRDPHAPAAPLSAWDTPGAFAAPSGTGPGGPSPAHWGTPSHAGGTDSIPPPSGRGLGGGCSPTQGSPAGDVQFGSGLSHHRCGPTAHVPRGLAGYGAGLGQRGFDRAHAATPEAAAWTLRAPVGFRRVSGAEVMSESAFEIPLRGPAPAADPPTPDAQREPVDTAAQAEAAAWTLWGRGTASGFDGQPKDDFSMDGTVFTGYLGLDYRLQPNVLLGLAVAHSQGDVDYETPDVTKGDVDITLTSVLPYAHWSPRPGLGVWGLFGAGWGNLALRDEAGKVKTDLEMLMAAVGARQELLTWRQIDVALKADAFLTELEAGADDRLPKTAGDAQRLRLMLEGRTAWTLSEASHLTPIFEIGGRWDGGKAETGVGAELGGGFEYAHTKLGLGIEARGRYLLAHQKSAFDEWGASLTLKLDPGADKRGLWLALAPVWGAEASQVEQMWGSAEVMQAGAETDTTPSLSPAQVEFDVGYGLVTHEGAGLLTTYGGLSMAGPATCGVRLGGRIELGEWIDLSVEGERTTQAGGAEHQVALYGHLGW